MSDWQQAWERDKHTVGRAVHEAWAAEKQRQGFADHVWKQDPTIAGGFGDGECFTFDVDGRRCRLQYDAHHPDMLDYDDLAPDVQEYDIQTGIVGYRFGYEARATEIAALRARLEAASAALAVEKALDEVYEWQRETFPLRTPSSIAAHLAEEAGELAREPLDTEEMADVAMLLSGLVRDTGTDLAAAIRAKLAKNRIRDWSAPPNEQGYVKARAALAEHDAAGEEPDRG